MQEQWDANTYPPLDLDERAKADFKHITMVLIYEALVEYDAFDQRVPRILDDDKWKPIKKRGNMTIYRERRTKPKYTEHHNARESKSQLPVCLIGNGTVDGTLEDVMYGTASPDEAAHMQALAFAKVRTQDGQTLNTIEMPSPDHPFRSLRIEWALSGFPKGLNGIIKHRDSVSIRATGVLEREDGERIGYSLTHGIDHPSVPPLKSVGAIRCQLSQCALFKQIRPNAVEVYTKGYYELFGKVLDSIAVGAMADSYLASTTAVDIANQKKLTWLLYRSDIRRLHRSESTDSEMQKHAHGCQNGTRRFNPMHKTLDCRMCRSQMCRSCNKSFEKVDVLPKLRLRRMKVAICSACDHRVKTTSAYLIARQEVLAGRYENTDRGTTLIDRERAEDVDSSTSLWSNMSSCPGESYDFHPRPPSSISMSPLSYISNLSTPSYSSGEHGYQIAISPVEEIFRMDDMRLSETTQRD